MKLKKEVSRINKSQMVECNKQISYFTIGKRYEVENVYYNNGTETTDIVLVDDDNDNHPIEEDVFHKFFKLV
jgi:hypothetical protein